MLNLSDRPDHIELILSKHSTSMSSTSGAAVHAGLLNIHAYKHKTL